MNPQIQYPAWYLSSQGPQISSTVVGIVGNILPIVALFLSNKGFDFIPGSFDPYIEVGVFLFFSIKAAVGYVKAKRTLGARIIQLEEKLGGHYGKKGE